MFDGGGGTGLLSASANSIVDLSQGALQNVASMTVNMGANSLLIVPAGFNTSTGFASYSSPGLTHTAGTTLVVPAGQGFGGVGSISDSVSCQGTITAASGSSISLNNGLVLSGSGVVSLGGGTLTVNDLASGMSGGSLSAGEQCIGYSGTGAFTQSGGTNAAYVCLGYNAGDCGTYNLSSGCMGAGGLCVGNSGAGTFTQSGGTNFTTNHSIILGYSPGGNGTYSITGGSVNVYSAIVGESGTGAFTQSGGTCSSASLTLGLSPGSSGTYSLNGGLRAGGSADIGVSGTAAFTQSGGTNAVPNGLYLGDYHVGSGTYSITGGSLGTPFGIFVGYSGTGAFIQSGGTTNAGPYGCLYLGYNSGGSGTYALSGSGLLASANYEYIGYSGTGSFTQSGGTQAVSTVLYVGWGTPADGLPGGNGTYLFSGGSLSAGTTNIGYGGTGVFTQSGGTNTVSNSLVLGEDSGASGTYNLNGGVLLTPTLSQGSGTATFNFGGGTLQAGGSFSTTLPMTLTGSGGNATVNTNGFAVTISGSLSGPGTLVETGCGELTLSGTNTYGGGTIVNQGNFVFTSTAAIPSSGSIQINSPGAVNISGAHTTASSWIGSGKINANSTGALALTGSSNENINFAGYNTLSLGATGTQTYTGTITPAGSGYNLGGGGGTLVYNGPALSGSNRLTIDGNVTLAAAQSYSGATTISSGTLEVTGGNNRLPTATVLTIASDGVLDLNGSNQTVGSLSGSSGAIVANNSAGTNTSTLTVNSSSVSTTFAGNIVNNVALALSGSGELILSGTDSYSGGTTVTGGTLDITAASARVQQRPA